MSDNHRQKIRRYLLQQGFGAQQTAGQLVKKGAPGYGGGHRIYGQPVNVRGKDMKTTVR